MVNPGNIIELCVRVMETPPPLAIVKHKENGATANSWKKLKITGSLLLLPAIKKTAWEKRVNFRKTVTL